jgi:ABC-type amino acid transport substrate-binding protein
MMRLAPAIVALAVAVAASATSAAARNWTDELTGRLARIKSTRVVHVGYREAAVPFSYLGPDAKPVGYSIDVCRAIVATIAEDFGVALSIDYEPVTVQNRIERIVSGTIDLECGATSITAERQREVAFSPAIFVTGTRIVVLRKSAIREVADLRGRTVAVVRGTTNEAAMREVGRLRRLGLDLVATDGYREALELLTSGRAVALAADEVLAQGYLAETGKASEFMVVGEQLSFEPYGIMYPRDDPQLAEVVERTLRGLASSREIAWFYERWFVQPLPSGRRMDLPKSIELRRTLEIIGLPAD